MTSLKCRVDRWLICWIPIFIVGLLAVCGGASSVFAGDAPILTHGPMVGKPTANSMRIWGRTSVPTTFEVRYGVSAERLDEKSAPVATLLEHDNAGWVELSGLKSDTRYHYRLVIGGYPQGETGTFRTLPSTEEHRHPELNPKGLFNFRFQIGSCANQNPLHGIGPSLPTYKTMLRDVQDRVHFAIMNGDWLYEELREHPVEAWRLAHGVAADGLPRVVQRAPTIVGVWENYRLYLQRGVPLAQWHRQVPSFFTFDDHELVNDIWGTGTAGHRHRRTVFRDIGIQAWHDYLGWANPVAHEAPIWFGRGEFRNGSDLLVDRDADFTKMSVKQMANLHVHWGKPTDGVNEIRYDDDSGHPNSKVYDIVDVVDRHTLRISPKAVADGTTNYSIGRRNYGRFRVANCEFFLLDTRSHRDMHDVRRRDKPGISMLGKAQREWLIDGMKNSDADFFFVVSSVPFTIPHIGAGGFEFDEQNKDESWTVFLDERETLIKFWETLKRPVFVMTGDLHNSFAIKLTDRVWEFCSGPHNSVNHIPKEDEADRPATGPFKFGGRTSDIRWSSYLLSDVPRAQRLYPYYLVVQVNNVFNTPKVLGDKRHVAFPHPQVIFQYFDGRTGELQYAEAVNTR